MKAIALGGRRLANGMDQPLEAPPAAKGDSQNRMPFEPRQALAQLAHLAQCLKLVVLRLD